MAVVVDGSFVLPGLNEALKEMKVGDKRTVEIKPEKAFGDRKAELIKLIPESKFKEQDIDVTPSSFVNVNNVKGKVISVDGGRIRVDFNHPLAGKVLEYEIEIVSEIKEKDEKVKAVTSYFTGILKEDMEVAIKEKEVEIILKKRPSLHSQTKETVAKSIIKWVGEVEKVKFVDIYENK